MISAKIIADSISENGVRLVTMQLKAPKFLDAEFEKHRMISSNSSSDRAIPLKRMLEAEYFLPTDVRLNQAGMQGTELMSDDEVAEFHQDLIHLHGYTADILTRWNKVHKQHLNRYLMGFSWQSKVCTATEWNNFFLLRDHPAADPAMQKLAQAMKQAMRESIPNELHNGEWHLPYIHDLDIQYLSNGNNITALYEGNELDTLIKCSAARCARTSYNKHDGTTPSVEDDLELYNQLATRPHTDKRGFHYGVGEPVHLSPLEHQATPMITTERSIDWDKGASHLDKYGNLWSGNLRGWVQYRKMLED